MLLSILLIFLIKGLSVSGDVPECDAMKPVPVVTQQVGGPPSRFIYFGVFEGKKLTKPVEVANFKWLYKDGEFEEGKVDKPPYDEKKDGVIILEPGVYYTAV